MNDPVVIVSAARTPLGAFQGELAGFTAPQLGAHAIRAAVERAHLPADGIDEVLVGCVLPAGLGQAPARQAALAAGLDRSTVCSVVSKVCGSGMKALMLAHDVLATGGQRVVVAGGMESMTQAPYLLPKARAGYRLGHGQMLDHMFLDGLEDHYGAGNDGRLMGSFAEDCATHFNFSRARQDAFAVESTLRARHARDSGLFDWEIAPMTVKSRKAETVIDQDEGVSRSQVEKIATLRPQCVRRHRPLEDKQLQ